MNLRLENYGKISEQWWLEKIEKFPLGTTFKEISVAGGDEDICLHILCITESNGKTHDITLGYPNEDENGVEFNYPSGIDYFDESGALLEWIGAIEVREKDNTEEYWELCELFKELHDYELYLALTRVKDKIKSNGYYLDPTFTISLMHHDDQDTSSLQEREEIIRVYLENLSNAQVKTLAINTFLNNERRKWLIELLDE